VLYGGYAIYTTCKPSLVQIGVSKPQGGQTTASIGANNNNSTQHHANLRGGSSTDTNSSSLEEGAASSGGAIINDPERFAKQSKKALNKKMLNDDRRSRTNQDVGEKARSSGDHTRQSFYIILLVALVSRFICIPIEAFAILSGYKSHYYENSVCLFVQTFPELVFASAYSLIVLFYAQLAGTIHVSGTRGLSFILSKRNFILVVSAVIYSVYFILAILTATKLKPKAIFQKLLWILFGVVYFFLLVLLSYFGPTLVILLRPSLTTFSGLAIRLISMCVLCTFVFATRTVSFALAAILSDARYTHGFLSMLAIHVSPPSVERSSAALVFSQNMFGYMAVELLPSVLILIMMHPRPSTATSGATGSGSMKNSPASGANSAHNTPPGLTTQGPNFGGRYQGYQSIPRNTSGSAPKDSPPVHISPGFIQQQPQQQSFRTRNTETKPLLRETGGVSLSVHSCG